MAAKTPSSVNRESMGSKFLLRANFTDIDDADTWASGLDSTNGQWCNTTDVNGITTSNVAVSFSSGTFTFSADEANKVVELYIMTNG